MTQDITTQEPKSQFLINQERIMATRAQQDRDVAERQKHSITPGSQEPAQTQGSYTIERFDATNNKTTRRTITPLPTPTRLQPPKPITKEELIEMLNTLRDEMATQQERFDNKDAIDKANAEKRQELSATIAELSRQLSAAQSELDQLNAAGSVRDGWIAFTKQAENRIVSIATGVYNFLLEKFSQDRHEASYRELTELLREEIRFKVDRSGVRSLSQASFARLHAVPKDSITNARVEASLEKVFTAAEKLERILEK
jgi:hypothetical protein